MNDFSFYSLDDEQKKSMLEICLGKKGTVISTSSGLCGDIYIVDQGECVIPRYICAKVPKQSNKSTNEEIADRFVNELRKQLQFYHHAFVHWAFDFLDVMGAPVALFRYWGSDLNSLVNDPDVSDVQKLSSIVYIIAGLRHCYNKGLQCHQDLKPANIFMRDVKTQFRDLPNLDVYKFALVADFGLADAFSDSKIFDGSRPYMAPEQWDKSELSSKTDVFALGVILFELMTGGHHPIGIKLNEFWPHPMEGRSTKWTREEPWKKWGKSEEKVCKSASSGLDYKILEIIQEMLSTRQSDRPDIDEVSERLLSLIASLSPESCVQVEFLLNYFQSKVSDEPLEKQWPHLFHSWRKFEAKFLMDK